jgi:hypothetical protein
MMETHKIFLRIACLGQSTVVASSFLVSKGLCLGFQIITLLHFFIFPIIIIIIVDRLYLAWPLNAKLTKSATIDN